MNKVLLSLPSGEVITSLTVAESDGEKKGKRVTGAGKARKEK